MEVNFSISLSFLLNHSLNIYFEEQSDKLSKCEKYALNDFLKKYKDLSEEEAKEELDKYFSIISPNCSEIEISLESIKNMSKWILEEHTKTNEYKNNIRQAKLIYLSSYVFDKKTEEMIECDMGEHRMAIFKLCAKYLSRKYPEEFNNDYFSISEKYFDELDEYIKENLVIKGEYLGKSSYSSFQNVGINGMIID